MFGMVCFPGGAGGGNDGLIFTLAAPASGGGGGAPPPPCIIFAKVLLSGSGNGTILGCSAGSGIEFARSLTNSRFFLKRFSGGSSSVMTSSCRNVMSLILGLGEMILLSAAGLFDGRTVGGGSGGGIVTGVDPSIGGSIVDIVAAG